MNLRRVALQFRDSWRLLGSCVLVGLLLAGLASVVQHKTYEATAEVLVSPNAPLQKADGVSEAYVAGLFTQQRAQTYVDLGTSPAVLDPVARQLGIPGGPDLAGHVTVTLVEPATALDRIKVTYNSPEMAADIANAIAAQLAAVVDRIERPNGGALPPVKLATASVAQPPTSPVSPKPALYLLIGLFVGLVVGVPLVLARMLLDRSVTESVGLADATGEAPLGVIGRHSSGGPVMREDPRSATADAFRKLRTAMQFALPEGSAHSVVVTGAQPGAGASTVAANLAVSVAEAGRQVILVDGNLRDPAVARLLGVAAGPGLGAVLAGDAELDAVLQSGGLPGLRVLPAAAEQTGALPGGPALVRVLERLEAQADLVIIDAPALLPFAEAADFAALADGVLLVVRFAQTGIDEVQQARITIAQVRSRMLGVVINAVPGRNPAGVVGAGVPPVAESPASSAPAAMRSAT
ncbi:MAG: Wzz/FepE/Etk N-terminal domain-containing protein [Pseudonocardiales bacterium]